ncbi:FAD-dependent monooxygenase [Amycolatopsis nigrescens]|uniref:FAD-dependent monooxygenase n=1 Tax=Amycolatopsis nigrescens TaxID=381445 RepID=UPI0003720AC1|nr:FAD-dependent monooxygenase [Amycolatopsis nigrescens]
MDIDVLIAGAGPTGLTLAIDLARRGIGVRIVERADTYFAGSRGDGLQPRTLEVFDDLGVVDEVLAAGMAPVPMRVHVGGEVVGERRMSPVAEPSPSRPYPSPWMLGQSRTEAILRDRLACFGVTVELGTELTGFDQDADGVTATLNGAETVRSQYLVGADGGRSLVRKSLGIAFEGSTDESIRMLLGDVRADRLDHSVGHWFAAADDPMAGIAMTPLSGGRSFQFGAPLAADREPSLATLQELFDRLAGPAAVPLTELTWSTVWRPNVRLAERFRDGRVFLAGDAAHVHPPTGGQGLNTGVQDAYNLGWKLADGSPELLDSYQRERRAVAERVLGISSELLRKYTEGDPDAHERGENTRQLDVGYRAEGETSPVLAAGDRAPDAPLKDPRGGDLRLFDLFRGPHGAVLDFGGRSGLTGEHVHTVLRPGSSSTVDTVGAYLDVDGHAFEAYGVTGSAVFHIRPDSYVGSRS